MKFLDRRFESRNLMPINIVSYDSFDVGARDAIAITFKDLDTDQVFVETIDHPKYEVYVLKPELWPKMTFMDVWQPMENLDKYLVSYHNRDRELARILGCEPDQVRFSNKIFGYDMTIEHYYWCQFLLEYGNDLPKRINVGYFDIESDIVQAEGFAAPGEAPTSAITFIDARKRDVYTLALTKDNLPVLAESNPHFQEYEDIRKKFYEQVEALKADIDGFIADCHKNFDEFYGEMNYHLMLVDDEIRIHQLFWSIIHNSNVDFIMAWNAPYDARNLIERPLALGYEPESIICDDAFKYKTCFFEEDENVQVHKRNHKVNVSIKPLILCQMWLYAGIRSGKGKLPSMKLNAIAKTELKDEKLNYEEEGNIKTFMYKNYRKYIMYNIKDVLLQFGIGNVTKDIDSVYDRCYENAMLIPEAFVSTTMLTTSLTKYFLKEGFVIGTNANKIMPPFDYHAYLADSGEMYDGEESSLLDPDDIVEEATEAIEGDEME